MDVCKRHLFYNIDDYPSRAPCVCVYVIEVTSLLVEATPSVLKRGASGEFYLKPTDCIRRSRLKLELQYGILYGCSGSGYFITV